MFIGSSPLGSSFWIFWLDPPFCWNSGWSAMVRICRMDSESPLVSNSSVWLVAVGKDIIPRWWTYWVVSGASVPLSPESTGSVVFQIPLRLSVVYVDREKDAGFKGYQVPNTAIDVRSAIPSSRSRTASVYSPGCLQGLSKGSASSSGLFRQDNSSDCSSGLSSDCSSRLFVCNGWLVVTASRQLDQWVWLYSADPKRSDILLAKCPFY